MSLLNHVENSFTHGVIDAIEAQSIPDGAASASKNWLTMGDSIELRRGYAVKGTAIAGVDPVTGMHVGQTALGDQVLFWSYLRKILFFDESLGTPDHAEVGVNVLAAAASGEDVSFASYFPIAGAQVWFSSPNSGLYKMMVNGGKSSTVAPSVKDNYDAAKNFKGLIVIALNRMFLWGRPADKTGLYLSYIDEGNTSAVSAESYGTGDGATKTFAATLAAVTGTRTCYGVSVTDGVETFTDNFDGTLTGSAGGTGTVNYSTGAVSVTFIVAPTLSTPITASYNWEDSDNNGIADFTYSATRVAGQGAIFRQDQAGSPIQRVGFYKQLAYCFHKVITYTLDTGNDDTSASNLPYRDHVGIPNWRAAVPAGEGIYYIDDTEESNPVARILTFTAQGQEVIPLPISSNLDLSAYRFDRAAGLAWQDYILFFCRTTDSTYNNVTLAYNKLWKSWDVLDYFASCADIYNGALVAGDSLSPNALELFSGFDDDGNTIDNYWIGKLSDLKIRELKKSNELWIRGLIQTDQNLDVYLSIDNGDFVLIGSISGSGPYVDAGTHVSIGANTIGQIGIGGGSAELTASPYFRRFKIRQLLDKFERIQVKYVATDLGFVSVSEREFHDISTHGDRLPPKYATNNT